MLKVQLINRHRAPRHPGRVTAAVNLGAADLNAVVTLTRLEAHLLRFFADQGDPPRVRSEAYATLSGQGLIRREEASSSYRITELGREAAMMLHQE